MSLTLVICGRDATARTWFDMRGQPLLARHPGRVLLFVDAQAVGRYPVLPNCIIEGIEYQSQERMLALAREHHAREGITAVCTLDERSVEFAAQLREALGLPGMAPALAQRFRDKVVMKQLLGRAGMRVPEFLPLTDGPGVEALLQRHGALVVKPRDGLGSRNVSFVRNLDELARVRAATRDPQNYEAEEFIEGTLYHTNSVVVDGEVRFTAVAPYLPGMGNIDYTSGTPFVSLMLTEGPLYERLCEFSRQAITTLGLVNGVTHLEAFHSSRDEIVFCETASRPGGGGIVHMIEAQYGVNMSLAALLSEEGRGQEALAPLHAGERRFGLVGMRNSGMGRVELSVSERSFSMDWVHHLQLDVQAGQFRPPSSHCTDFMGLAIIDADDEDQFRSRVGELRQRFDSVVRLAPL
jgi:hypothetical protein